jgi:hypothetical protein
MIIYNLTITIEQTHRVRKGDWMNRVHVPDMLRMGASLSTELPGDPSGILQVVDLDETDTALAVSFVDDGGIGA